MPSARSATAARRSATAPSRSQASRAQARRPPRLAALRDPILRVRWDRAGRIALLVVLTVVVGIYAQRTLAYLSTSAQASHQQRIVDRLQSQNAALAHQLRSLNQPATIVRDARVLGMVRPGEQSYVLTGHAARP
ncbi:MAG TPA: septum formation initiator family protein [Solirubrobacteraceae bacterium]|nr:septum formation initiator family protein [Solirubrobacteraceae bacterium]